MINRRWRSMETMGRLDVLVVAKQIRRIVGVLQGDKPLVVQSIGRLHLVSALFAS
jgi:hypothetical protein